MKILEKIANLKYGIQQYIGVILALGSSVIGLMIYAIIVGAIRDTQTVNSLPWNIANSGLALFSGVTTQFGTIGSVSGVLLLAAVVFGFGFGGYMLYQKATGK